MDYHSTDYHSVHCHSMNCHSVDCHTVCVKNTQVVFFSCLSKDEANNLSIKATFSTNLTHKMQEQQIIAHSSRPIYYENLFFLCCVNNLKHVFISFILLIAKSIVMLNLVSKVKLMFVGDDDVDGNDDDDDL